MPFHLNYTLVARLLVSGRLRASGFRPCTRRVEAVERERPKEEKSMREVGVGELLILAAVVIVVALILWWLL